jgi:hypothetical protein
MTAPMSQSSVPLSACASSTPRGNGLCWLSKLTNGIDFPWQQLPPFDRHRTSGAVYHPKSGYAAPGSNALRRSSAGLISIGHRPP